MERMIVQHLHTKDSGKKPSPDSIMDGELAINYVANGETLFIKNSEGAIAEFKDDKYYQKQLSEKTDKTLSLTYSELVSLRDNSQLIPGQQYRITDYVTTTIQENTRSAGNVFDIIVKADSENKLNEEASAIQHTKDDIDYFANSDLSAWKLWYCLDNDTERFAWADATNGKGVIYRMIDEWNNDVPYDFKNIQFARDWSVIAPDSRLTGTTYCYTFSIFLDGFIEGATASDESVKAKECIESDEDGSFGNNVIRTYQNLGVCFLNGIVFVTNWTSFSVNHYSNTFGNDCYNNTFGNDCYNNTFGTNCYNNTFGNEYSRNTFGNECYSNTFGNECSINTFGDDCWNNTFGNNCWNNTFGNECYRNTFGNGCIYINFASDAYDFYQHNHFGDGCRYIVFTGAETASSEQQVQNYNFAQGLQGTSSAYLTIDGKRNRTYETYISKDTDGTIKESVIADTATKEYVDTEIDNIPIEKGTMTNSIVQKGSSNDASGNSSSAFGWKTRATGNMSHTEGFLTLAQNSCEHAEGYANISIQGKTIHTVGIGASSTNRKNAHEIHLDGKHYIYGIGGYDGTNSQTEGIKTVQEVVGEVENKLDNCVDLTSEQTITGVKKFESTTSVKSLSLRTKDSADDSRDSEIYVLPPNGDLWNRMIIGGNKWAARLFIEGMSSQNYIPISDTEVVTAGYLKNFAKLDEGRTFTAAQTFGGGINMNGTRVLKVAEPTDLTDATNKQYVDTQVKTVDDKVVALEARATNAVQITYAELKALRDAGKLVPGTQYRITDYQCTTSQSGTKSAGHQFDIIVTADDASTLNEVARAIKHDGDAYFANSDLNAWKIWYCLDNDTNRFAWADSANGKGIIYRMIDEFGNDVPYDFKNIQFYRQWDATKSLWCTISSDTTGVPCYTFSSSGDSATTSFTDMSLQASNMVYSNVIGKYVSSNKQTLNNICFFGNDCNSNTFGNSCFSNTFGNYFQNNTFGNHYYSNTFGNSCSTNTFGNHCSNNTFGNYCGGNTFGNNCYLNTFGNNCKSNTFGNDCYSNTFGNHFLYNTFGNYCYSNTFGNSCSRNTFGNNCIYIKFASDASVSTKYNYYQHNHFGDGCQYIVFTGAETASSSAQVQNYNFAQGLKGTSSAYLTIDGVRNLSYETKVAKNSNGEIKIYCEADLIL